MEEMSKLTPKVEAIVKALREMKCEPQVVTNSELSFRRPSNDLERDLRNLYREQPREVQEIMTRLGLVVIDL